MRPKRAQILTKNIVCRHIGRIENVADAAKNVSAVVEWNRANGIRQRNSRFEIDYCQGISAEGNRKRREELRLALTVSEKSLRHDNHARTGGFEFKTAQSRRASGKKS